MPDTGPSTRFRGTALTVLAAGGVFLTAVVITAGSLGLIPASSDAGTASPVPAQDPAMTDSYGASGILPETTSLSATLLASITTPRAGAAAAAGIPEGALQIPPPALAAYRRAEAVLAAREPDCRVSWTLLAGLGRVVSNHGDGSLDPKGNTTRPILGPRLNGSAGLAEIPDTDQGRLDGDKTWDRASGPFQIIPSVWKRIGADSDGDGTANPHNVFDAALGAGRYLCEGGVDLREGPEQARAVFRYQRSEVFVRAVIGWTQAYAVRLAEPPGPPPPLPPVEAAKLTAELPAGEMPAGEPTAPASAVPPPGPPPGPPPPPTGRPPTTPPPNQTTTTTPPPTETTTTDPTTPPSETTDPPGSSTSAPTSTTSALPSTSESVPDSSEPPSPSESPGSSQSPAPSESSAPSKPSEPVSPSSAPSSSGAAPSASALVA